MFSLAEDRVIGAASEDWIHYSGLWVELFKYRANLRALPNDNIEIILPLSKESHTDRQTDRQALQSRTKS